MIINSLEDFKTANKYGFNPFLDKIDEMSIHVRVMIQNELFKSDNQFYKYCWANLPHFCEETGLKLRSYSACFVSHILSRGAFPEMRYDIRNINILSLPAHKQWESERKKDMYIYKKNLLKINKLKNEYREL
tara:strand:- start:22276 stop:22671 length:396 start_codon:yes stop_codon:yes gene_type:complete